MSDEPYREDEEAPGEERQVDDGEETEGPLDTGESVEAEGSSDAVEPGAVGDPGEEADPVAGYEWTPDWLQALRRDKDRRHVALVAAAIVGLSAAWLHWLGLVLAGALVGLVSESVPKALVGGLVVGVLVLVVHVGASPVMSAGEFVGLAPAVYVTIGAALVAPLWGSVVRAVV